MKQNFRWGIVGTGGIANAFANDLKFVKNHRVSSVLSRAEQTGDQFKATISNCKVHTSIDSFMQDLDIDAVYVATPNTLHCDHTITALNYKKPVLCEKPVAMNAKEIVSMVKSSKDNNTTFLEGMWMRYLPHIEYVNHIIHENMIGSIQSVFACHGQNLTHVDNPRLWTKDLGGGALLDLGIYVVSFAHMILGPPEQIIANSFLTPEGVDAKTSMIFKYSNGAFANLSCSMYDTQPNRAVISGDNGWIEIAPTFYGPSTVTVKTITGKQLSYNETYKGHGLREQAIELENCVTNNTIESSKMPHNESIAVMESIDKIRKIIGLKFD